MLDAQEQAAVERAYALMEEIRRKTARKKGRSSAGAEDNTRS